MTQFESLNEAARNIHSVEQVLRVEEIVDVLSSAALSQTVSLMEDYGLKDPDGEELIEPDVDYIDNQDVTRSDLERAQLSRALE